MKEMNLHTELKHNENREWKEEYKRVAEWERQRKEESEKESVVFSSYHHSIEL